MAMGRREKDIKLLVAKFVELVESLNPGERLSIKKVAAKKRPVGKTQPRRAPLKAASKTRRAKASREAGVTIGEVPRWARCGDRARCRDRTGVTTDERRCALVGKRERRLHPATPIQQSSRSAYPGWILREAARPRLRVRCRSRRRKCRRRPCRAARQQPESDHWVTVQAGLLHC